jgi:hypothetical protein
MQLRRSFLFVSARCYSNGLGSSHFCLSFPIRFHGTFSQLSWQFEEQLTSSTKRISDFNSLRMSFQDIQKHPLISNSASEALPEDPKELESLMRFPLVLCNGIKLLHEESNSSESLPNLQKDLLETSLLVARCYAPFLSDSRFSRQLSVEKTLDTSPDPPSQEYLSRARLSLSAVSGALRSQEAFIAATKDHSNASTDLALPLEDTESLTVALKLPISCADHLSSSLSVECLRCLCKLLCENRSDIIPLEALTSLTALCGVFVRRMKHTRNSVQYQRENFALQPNSVLNAGATENATTKRSSSSIEQSRYDDRAKFERNDAAECSGRLHVPWCATFS